MVLGQRGQRFEIDVATIHNVDGGGFRQLQIEGIGVVCQGRSDSHGFSSSVAGRQSDPITHGAGRVSCRHQSAAADYFNDKRDDNASLSTALRKQLFGQYTIGEKTRGDGI